MNPLLLRVVWLALALCQPLTAALEITPAQVRQPPTRGWLEEVLTSKQTHSWAELEQAAVSAALGAAGANRTEAMEGWVLVARWARLLATDQRLLTDRWVDAINSARLGHAHMTEAYDPPSAPLSALLSSDFVIALVTDADLSSSFFDLVTPYDQPTEVMRILYELHGRWPRDFERYAQLALAVALVHDVPPPPGWPHGQVPLSRVVPQLPSPAQVYRFWVDADRQRQTLHRLSRLSASELKFVIDAAAPPAELRWVQGQLEFDFDSLPRAYDAVKYRHDRIDAGAYIWPQPDYALPNILGQGGICIDQAYFASQVGKARGVPTLLFRGAGRDGRHAWFGYLDAQQRWQMDVGRYAEQKLVSGEAYDPQTWAEVNDHELAFLAERFHQHPRYRQSRAWLYVAKEQLRLDDTASAMTSARKATGLEPRNVMAWDTRVIAEEQAALPLVKREATLRNAARAMQRYPDLYLRFMREALHLMRERGQTSAADHEERMLARRFTADRSDLALAQAATMLNRSLAEDDPATQLRVFENTLRQFGVGARMEAFDRLVRPFVEQAMREQRWADAEAVLRITLRMLPVEPGSQFARELAAAAKQVQLSRAEAGD